MPAVRNEYTDTGFSSRENSYDTRSDVSETQNIDTPFEQTCDFFFNKKVPIKFTLHV